MSAVTARSRDRLAGRSRSHTQGTRGGQEGARRDRRRPSSSTTVTRSGGVRGPAGAGADEAEMAPSSSACCCLRSPASTAAASASESFLDDPKTVADAGVSSRTRRMPIGSIDARPGDVTRRAGGEDPVGVVARKHVRRCANGRHQRRRSVAARPVLRRRAAAAPPAAAAGSDPDEPDGGSEPSATRQEAGIVRHRGRDRRRPRSSRAATCS